MNMDTIKTLLQEGIHDVTSDSPDFYERDSRECMRIARMENGFISLIGILVENGILKEDDVLKIEMDIYHTY